LPLSDIRVVHLTRILAGPFCTMLLGDMGAENRQDRNPGFGRSGAAAGGDPRWVQLVFRRLQSQQALGDPEPAPG
jgi:crotonobetainyl-CoA:carnitine CoA-transferase CaiB-like acyl-CoA transferase